MDKNPVTEADLENPFSRMTEAKLLTDFTQAPQKGNLSGLPAKLMLRVKSGTESTGACPVPSGGFNGVCNPG